MAGEAFVYSFTHSNIGTSAQIIEKLADLSQGATNDPPSGEKGCFTGLRSTVVLEVVVAETHVALLTDDGRICRIRFTEEQPPVSRPATGRDKSDDEAASTSSTRSYGSRSASPRPDGDDRPPSFNHVWGSIVGPGSGSPALITSGSGSGGLRVANRGRILLRRRGGGHGIVTRWPMIPAVNVPDELVEQAMGVLQGISREMVIRELQRTNLDVNQAVNNLLSREDDDGDGSHDEGSSGFLASGEELLNLLGSGMANVGEEDLDEVLGRSRAEEGGSGGRDSRLTLYEFSDPLLQSEIRSLVSLGDSAAGGGGGSSGEHSKRPSSRGGSTVTVPSKKKKTLSQPPPVGPVLFDSSAEWWGGEKDGYTFKHIAGLYSDLLAVDSAGKLRGWAWSNHVPHKIPHTLEASLELGDEKIKFLSAKLLRGSLVTESGKIATFVDKSVYGFARRLVHKCHSHPELCGENITRLSVSELVSAIGTESGKVFWWGVLPFNERKQAISQNQDKLRLLKYQHSSGSDLQEGCSVCLRSCPVYSTGTKAIHIKGTQILCGILQEDVMSPTLSEKCQFKIVPPSMASKAEEKVVVERHDPDEATIVHIGTKRSHSEDGLYPVSVSATPTRTEVWSLRDVIFTDHVTNLREGSVVKIDGNYAAVHYPPLDASQLSQANLEGCRLLRKDELVPVSEVYPHQTPYFTQDTPRRLRTSSHHLLTLTTDSRGVHCLFSVQDLIHYTVFNLNTGKPNQNSQFGELSSQYLLKQGGPLQLVPINLSLGVVLDSHGGLFPVSKNNTGNMRDLPLLNLPPVSCVGVGVCSSKNTLISLPFKKQLLIPAILKKDLSAVNRLLTEFKDDPARLTFALTEHCSGGCNVFHVLAALARPPDPTPVQQGEKKGLPSRSTPRGLLRDIMKQAMAVASSSTPPLPSMDWSSEGVNETEVTEESHDDMALDIFDVISSIEGQTEVLTRLLQEKNLDGYTPFMAAVAVQSYGLACLTFQLAQRVSESDEDLLLMLYPPDSHPDDNPIFVVARNDTCSFTWTGEEHIQQDIFECRTCGLIGSLCCCTECAYTCHRGHDCSFKKASPTAYCDCWEVGKCRSLAPGFDFERKNLFDKLLKSTSLGTKVNGRGEYLIGLLAATVARQTKEQSHLSGVRLSGSLRHSRTKHDDVSYNLPPPRFAQKALALAMENWECVKAVLMCGCDNGDSVDGVESHVDTLSLDAFTYLLLSKLNQKILDSLLTVLVKSIGPDRSQAEPCAAAARFVRSIIRVFTVAQVESSSLPAVASGEVPSKWRSYSSSPLIERAQKVFASLSSLTVKELVLMARAAILPVMLGIARPVDISCMTERVRVCEEVFRMPFVSLLRVPTCEEDGAASEEDVPVDHDTESEIGEDDHHSVGAITHDASSTVTTGSHLVFLSDQDSSDGEDVESVPDDVSIGESHEDDTALEPSSPSHRVTFGVHWALPQSHSVFTHHTSSSRVPRTSSIAKRDARDLSMGTAASLLAQTFSILVRQLAETVDNLWDMVHTPTPPGMLPVADSDPNALYDFVWAELEEVWVWLFNCMDMLQSQLKFGSAMNKKDPKGLFPSKHEPTSEARENRKEFFSYMLTLFRGQFSEHGGRLPAVDVTGMEHVAWTLDALYHLLQNTRPPPPPIGQSKVDEDCSKFFRRSQSTLCLGMQPRSPFDPLVDALPLADKPQLMDSIQDKELLFGHQIPVPLRQWPTCPLPPPPILYLLGTNRTLPGMVWPKPREGKGQQTACQLSEDEVCGWDSHKMAASILVGRWDNCLDVFARAFMDTVGKHRCSVLSQEQQFERREKEFRREMDLLRTASHKEMIVEVDRSRNKFLSGLFVKLNHYCDHQSITGSHGSHPLAIHRLKVTFSGEPGEGSGVLRSMFTAAAEALLSDDPPPSIEVQARSLSVLTTPTTSGRRSRDKHGSLRHSSGTSLSAARKQSQKRGSSILDSPLFYQPGKTGFYAPRVSTNSVERLNAYRNVGRLIGLCLLHTEVMTFPLCRHVFKYLLKREISWHDFAFFDSGVYESLRKMIIDSRKPDGAEYLSSLGLTFTVTLRPDEGGGTHDLVEGAGSTPVAPDNVYEYVRKYTLLRMITVNQEPLQHMREGVYEAIPELSLSRLTAEDLRLLLCGCPHIDMDVVRGITVFDDESRKDQEQLTRFKGWFWSVFERMTQRERQDLLYFWTSSPVLPASVDSYQPSPSVTIRPPDDQHLPTANTCISRLYVPLYSSKAILRTRLLTAIKTKAFGFV